MISKRIYPAFVMILSVMLLLMSNVTVFAVSGSEIDMDETGSISITIKYENNPVAGGSLTLYNVASISLDDGNLSYVLTSDFLDFETDFSDISSDTFAKDLKNYADANKLEGKTEEVDEDGKVSFEGLNLGLYLMVQKDAADGYYEMNGTWELKEDVCTLNVENDKCGDKYVTGGQYSNGGQRFPLVFQNVYDPYNVLAVAEKLEYPKYPK